jgi:myo-inositol-1(or 4)-monophosphatase
VADVRRFGAAALDLAWVAAGRYDGFWELGLNKWDIAAGIVLVREAGGYVTDPAGQDAYPLGMVVAGNPHLHGKLREMVQAGIAAAEAGRAAARNQDGG